MKRPCRKCGRYFERKSRWHRVCDSCNLTGKVERNLPIRAKKIFHIIRTGDIGEEFKSYKLIKLNNDFASEQQNEI